jgi:hypothetical protein
MAKVLVFSKLFGVSEWEGFPNPKNYPKHTYGYDTESTQWYVSDVRKDKYSKVNYHWFPIASKDVSKEMKATALILNIPI